MINRKTIHLLLRWPIIAIAFSYFAVSSHHINAEETDKHCLRVGVDDNLGPVYTLFETMGRQLYLEAGLCAVTIPLPSKRIEKMLATNQLDADWIRMKNYAQEFNPLLIEVPRPLFRINAMLLSLKDDPFDGRIENLKGRTVAYQSGFRWLEKNLDRAGAIASEMPSNIAVSDLLKRKRVSIFATDSVRADKVLREFGGEQSGLRVTVWEKMTFHHMVHERHRDKVPALDTALKHMIDRGDLDQIFSLPGISKAE